MSTSPALNRTAFLAALVFFCALAPCVAQSIYKCDSAHGSVYTDRPCPAHRGKVLHQASDSDIIDHYLNLGQNELAQRYAEAHQLDALYASRVQAYQQQKEAEHQRQAAVVLAVKQHDEETKQRALADRRARQVRLEKENEALREQNDSYQDDIAPLETGFATSGYMIDSSNYNNSYHRPAPHGDHGHDHDHPPALPRQPVYHPCTQLAGERVVC